MQCLPKNTVADAAEASSELLEASFPQQSCSLSDSWIRGFEKSLEKGLHNTLRSELRKAKGEPPNCLSKSFLSKKQKNTFLGKNTKIFDILQSTF
jgi:hypothetical protein